MGAEVATALHMPRLILGTVVIILRCAIVPVS